MVKPVERKDKTDQASAYVMAIAKAFTDEMSQTDIFGNALPEVLPRYGGNTFDGVTCRVSDGNVRYDFVYSVRAPLGGKRSTLGVKIYFPDISEYIGLFMYDLADILESDNFRCYIYPLIESPERMRTIVKGLISEIGEFSGKIRMLAENGAARGLIEKKKQQVISSMRAENMYEFGSDEEKARVFEVYDAWYTAHMTSGAFYWYAAGKWKRALKIASHSYATEYEVRLAGYIKSTEGKYPPPCFDGCNTFLDFAKAEKKSSAGDFGRLFLSWFALLPVLSIGFLGLYYIIALICSRGALYSSLLELYNAVNVIILPAMITSIALSYFTAERMALKTRNELMRNYQLIMSSKKAGGCMTALTNVIAVASIVFTVVLAKTGVMLTPDGVIDSEAFSLRGDFYSYESVVSVECIKVTDGSGYDPVRIVMRTGEKVEFGCCNNDAFDEKIVPILRERGITVSVSAKEK